MAVLRRGLPGAAAADTGEYDRLGPVLEAVSEAAGAVEPVVESDELQEVALVSRATSVACWCGSIQSAPTPTHVLDAPWPVPSTPVNVSHGASEIADQMRRSTCGSRDRGDRPATWYFDERDPAAPESPLRPDAGRALLGHARCYRGCYQRSFDASASRLYLRG